MLKTKIDLERANCYAYILLIFGENQPHEIVYQSLGTLSGVVYAKIRTQGYFEDTDCLVTVCCNL